MRVAALHDVHGNLPALEAVLDEVARERVDRVVFGGDVAAGPFPKGTIARLRTVANASFVRGNADRYMVDAFDGEREPEGLADGWAVAQLARADRDFLASFEPTVSLDGVLYCHATPHSDEPLMTERSAEERVRALLGSVRERVVVCGHTHMQYDRAVGDVRLVNAGSVGLPYGTTQACWALVVDGAPRLRQTPYDRDALHASPYGKLAPFLRETTREEAIEFFEAQAAAG